MTTYLGRPVARKEGRDKVTGAARYVDDLPAPPGLLHGVTVRSSCARGRLRRIVYEPGVPWDDIVVVTAKDIPGENAVHLILNDQPFLADEAINHPEEAVVLLAHANRHVLEEARRRVKLEVEPLPAVHTIDDALAAKTVVWGEDNIFKTYRVRKGEAAAAATGEPFEAIFARPDLVVVEGEYRTGAQEQLYIEPQGMLADAGPGGVTVQGSMQCPYYVHKGLVPLFGLPEAKVRVIQVETGGGFGGKEEYPTLVAGHAALLSWKARKPVKIVYDRAEDMVATTKRHPSRTRHRTALTPDGKLVAMDIEFTIDGGAYATLSPVVLSRGTIHAAGPYACPNVRILSRAVATNAPPHGAFRGFGAPQSTFALERHLDRVAARLDLEPEELRRRNFLAEGGTTATSQTIRERLDLPGLLDRALAESDLREKRRRFAAENRDPARLVKKGIGLACFMHGAGFTGSGEKLLSSVAGVEAAADGRFRVLVASTEIGQGTNTILCQIAADALGVEVERVVVAPPDTATVPNSGPTVASRTCMVVGKLVEEAALELKGKLSAEPGAKLPVVAYAKYKQPPDIHWDEESYRGDAYGTYAWAVYVAEASVDTTTGEARVDDFVAVQEVGRVVNPVLASGQIEGGVAQGVGFALYESVILKEGRMANGQLTNYILPTTADAPRIRTIFAEVPYAHGPGGAKGIGELPMDGPAPAVVNAIAAAIGAPDLNLVPLLPETILGAVRP